jgi:cation transport ATPase
MELNHTPVAERDTRTGAVTGRQQPAHDQHEHDGHEDHAHTLKWLDLARIGLVTVAALATWLLPGGYPVVVIGLAATLVGGYPIFTEAFANLLARRMTMELSMTIALAAALVIGEFFTALVIVLFVLIAEVLEGLTVGRGRRAIKQLLNLLPQNATVRRAGEAREVHAGDIQVGDVVVVKPGGRVPVDGVVVAGSSFVDQAAITGESMPVEKVAGAAVYAGTINQSGVLEVRATSIGRDTAFGKIIQAVEQAEQSRAPIQKTADRLAGYLVYFALACAALTLFVTWAVRGAIDARDHLSHHRGRGVRHRRRDAAGGPGRHRPCRPAGGHRQGRPVPGSPRPGGHRGAGQDRHPDRGPAPGDRGRALPGCDRSDRGRGRRHRRAAFRTPAGPGRARRRRWD